MVVGHRNPRSSTPSRAPGALPAHRPLRRARGLRVDRVRQGALRRPSPRSTATRSRCCSVPATARPVPGRRPGRSITDAPIATVAWPALFTDRCSPRAACPRLCGGTTSPRVVLELITRHDAGGPGLGAHALRERRARRGDGDRQRDPHRLRAHRLDVVPGAVRYRPRYHRPGRRWRRRIPVRCGGGRPRSISTSTSIPQRIFGASPVICQAGLATLEQITGPLLEHVTDCGHIFTEAVAEAHNQFPEIIVRQPGHRAGAGPGAVPMTRSPAVFHRGRDRPRAAAAPSRPAGCITITPPLVISEVEMRRAVDLMAGLLGLGRPPVNLSGVAGIGRQ